MIKANKTYEQIVETNLDTNVCENLVINFACFLNCLP
jgi:hypothetical protein